MGRGCAAAVTFRNRLANRWTTSSEEGTVATPTRENVEDGASNGRARRRNAVVLAAVAVTALVGYLWGRRDLQREHDRHLVRREVARIEAAIRTGHGWSDWAYVERRDTGAPDSREHERHQSLLGDFERLAHVEGFALSDVEVELDEETARVRYRVTGRARSARQQPPIGGEMGFRRSSTGWELVSNRFVEAR